MSDMKASVIYLSRFNTCCGVSTYTEQLASAVAQRSVTVSALASDHALKTDAQSCRDWIPSIPSLVSWSEDESVLSALSDILDQKPDLIHIQHEFGIFKNTIGLIALCDEIKSKSPSTKLVITAHTVPPSVSGPDDAFVKLLCAMDAIIVHSELAKSIMLLYPGANAFKEVVTIPHGMMDHGHRIPKSQAEEALGLNPDPNRFTFLSLGFMSSNKRHAQLIQLFGAMVKMEYISPKSPYLIIAGMPTLDSHGEAILKSINMLVDSMNIRKHVSVFPEFVSFDRMPTFYGAADLSVHMCGQSYHSSSGSVRMDLAYGMPVLVQKAELTQDLPPGTVQFFSGDSDLLAFARVLSRDPKRLQEMSGRAHEMTSKNSWRAVSMTHKSLYRKLIGPSMDETGEHYRAAVFHSCGSLFGGGS